MKSDGNEILKIINKCKLITLNLNVLKAIAGTFMIKVWIYFSQDYFSEKILYIV